MLATIRKNFFADFLCIYRMLPQKLQRRTRLAFAAVLMQALLEVASIVSISFLAMTIASPERLVKISLVASVLGYFPSFARLQDDPRLFALLAAGFTVAFIAFKNFATALVSHLNAQLGQDISLYAGEVIFHNFLYSPYLKQLSGDSNDMFQALTWRDALGEISLQLMSVYSYAAVALALSITLICVTPIIILIVVVIMGIVAVVVYKALKKHVDKNGVEVAEWAKKANNVTLNALHGIRETLIYRQQGVFFQNFRESCLGGIPQRVFLNVAPPIPTWILETAGFVVLLATLWIMYGVLDSSMAHITTVLTMIMLVAWRLLPLLNRSMGALILVRSTRHAAMQCLERVETATSEPVQEDPAPDPDFVWNKKIALEQVSFRYPDAKCDSLCNISFTIPKGTRVGIIGQSGAGKSSLAMILSGLIPPSSGQFLVDAHPLSPTQLSAYRLGVGYVPQSPYILTGSLAENVAFSQWGKPWDKEKVLDACRMAELEIVQERGIDLQMGQGGAGLSGGQAQRLSIARALYANPTVLILDEATSALDTGIEQAIMKTIFALPQTITAIIIAHRLSTVEHCDSLVWIEKGCIRAMGTPAEILPRYEVFLKENSAQRSGASATASYEQK